MSPTESDLRGALRDGEGDGVDADRIVGLGRARRAQQRTRLLTGAAAVVLVAGLATGGAFLAGGSSPSGDARRDSTAFGASTAGSAGSRANAPAYAGPADGAGGRSAAASSAPSAGSAAGAADPCPVSYPQVMLPGGGSSQFGADGPMFAKTPVSLTVCAYGPEGDTGRPAVLVLTGDRATELADSLEKASTKRSYLPCPEATHPQQNRLAILGVAADGTRLTAVTTSVGVPQCSITATNGTAVRYLWSPPSDLYQVLLALTTRRDVQNPTDLVPGRVTKSPVR